MELADVPVTPAQIRRVEALMADGSLNAKLARQVFDGVIAGEGDVDEVVAGRGLAIVSDDSALLAAIDEALAAKEAGEERVILFNLSGHGNFDLAAYDAFLAGTLEDPEFSQQDMDAAVSNLPEGVPSL
jgi:hypothetical protein